jgi:predicted  nucleic acid-binding Zn-ribbon protein
MDGVKQALYSFATSMTPKLPSQVEKIKECICTNSLVNRVTTNWRIILMDSSTIIASTCVFITFAQSMTLICAAFTVLALTSGVGSFYMRRFEELRDVEETARDLRATKERFEVLAGTLERENRQLSATNQQLLQTNEAFRQTNRDFLTTNRSLTQQVASLTLQVTQLRESATRIRDEVQRFQQQNTSLQTTAVDFGQSLRALDQQIETSRALCGEITQHLSTQQSEVGQQLAQLGRYLEDLRSETGLLQRLQEFGSLNNQVRETLEQLHQLQNEYARERGNFEAIHTSLTLLRSQFDTSMTNAVSGVNQSNSQYQVNNQQFQNVLVRIQQLLGQYFPGQPLPAVTPLNNLVPLQMQTGNPPVQVVIQ